MSAPDRWEVYEADCHCTKGQYIVFGCDPGHAFVKDHQRWVEFKITCEDCSNNDDDMIKRHVLNLSRNSGGEWWKAEQWHRR